MDRWVLRFQSLVFRDEGDTAAIYFDVEDDDAIIHSKANIRAHRNGDVDVEIMNEGVRIDPELFAGIVRRIHAQKLRVLERIGAAVMRDRCAVALNDLAVRVEGRIAVGW